MKAEKKKIGREVKIDQGTMLIERISKGLTTAKRFKDVLVYDNLSDDALLTNYLLGSTYVNNRKLVSTFCMLNPHKDELAKDYEESLKLKNKEYGKDIDYMIKQRLKADPDGKVNSLVNYILTNIKVSVDSDLMFIAFMLGHYIMTIFMDNGK